MWTRCSRCWKEVQTTRHTLLEARASYLKRAGCNHCYRSKLLVAHGDRRLTVGDLAEELKLSVGALYDRLKRAGIDAESYVVLDFSEVPKGRTDGIMEARRAFKVGDQVGEYRILGYKPGGVYHVSCGGGHEKMMEADAIRHQGRCGDCMGRGQYGVLMVGGREFRISEFARIVGLSEVAVKGWLKKGYTPEQVLLMG